jgi:erythromycin esterase-like protein
MHDAAVIDAIRRHAVPVVWAHNSHLGDARATRWGRHEIDLPETYPAGV